MTAADYAEVSERDPHVQRAAATLPLDRLVAHGVRHRRPRRRARGRRRLRDRPARAPRAVPDGRLRPRGRRAALRAARGRAARLRRCPTTSARTSAPPCSTCSRAASAPTARSASSIPTASPSASRSTCRRSSRPRRAVPGVQSVTAETFQRQRDDASSGARHRRAADGPARDRAARRRPELPRARRARADRREAASERRPAPAAAARASATARRSLLENRPGLSAIAYRDRHARRLPRVDDRRAHRRRPARPRRGSARATRDDFTIALLDAWAVDRRRAHLLHRAARAGVVPPHRARADLAPGARPADRLPAAARASRPRRTSRSRSSRRRTCRPPRRRIRARRRRSRPPRSTLEPGLRVQSIPGPGEQPQTFETVEEIEARPEWNAIPASHDGRRSCPRSATRTPTSQGAGLNLKPGDPLLLAGGDVLARALGPAHADRRSSPDADHDRTRGRRGPRASARVSPHVDPADSPQPYVLRKRRRRLRPQRADVARDVGRLPQNDYPGGNLTTERVAGLHDLGGRTASPSTSTARIPTSSSARGSCSRSRRYRELWQVDDGDRADARRVRDLGQGDAADADGRRALRLVLGRGPRHDRLSRSASRWRSPRRPTTTDVEGDAVDVDGDVSGDGGRAGG